MGASKKRMYGNLRLGGPEVACHTPVHGTLVRTRLHGHIKLKGKLKNVDNFTQKKNETVCQTHTKNSFLDFFERYWIWDFRQHFKNNAF